MVDLRDGADGAGGVDLVLQRLDHGFPDLGRRQARRVQSADMGPGFSQSQGDLLAGDQDKIVIGVGIQRPRFR